MNFQDLPKELRIKVLASAGRDGRLAARIKPGKLDVVDLKLQAPKHYKDSRSWILLGNLYMLKYECGYVFESYSVGVMGDFGIGPGWVLDNSKNEWCRDLKRLGILSSFSRRKQIWVSDWLALTLPVRLELA